MDEKGTKQTQNRPMDTTILLSPKQRRVNKKNSTQPLSN